MYNSVTNEVITVEAPIINNISPHNADERNSANARITSTIPTIRFLNCNRKFEDTEAT